MSFGAVGDLALLLKRWLCVAGKSQICHLCGRLKLFFEKCLVKKNKNIEALTLGQAVLWFICSVNC
jgi:hypothetical protein